MIDRKPCIRCAREIDGYARTCPFCNWDQSETPPAEPAQPQPELAYTPPKDRRVQKKLFMLGGGVALLIASFLVGILIHGSDPDVEEEEQASTTTAAQVNPPRRSDLTLVPVTAADLEAPITSAPLTTTAEGVPTEYQRSDATAVSSDEYARLAARVKEERRKAREAVDPRSLTGAAYAAAPPRPKPPEPPPAEAETAPEERPFDREMPTEGLPVPAATAARTRPVPEYQPLPNISVSEKSTAGLDLVIGADGRVKEVTVRQSIPGQTGKILAAVQSWRFKPATQNGEPVSAVYSVDLTFGNE